MQCDQSSNDRNKTQQTCSTNTCQQALLIFMNAKTALRGWVYEHHTHTMGLSMLDNVREKWPTSEKMVPYLIK